MGGILSAAAMTGGGAGGGGGSYGGLSVTVNPPLASGGGVDAFSGPVPPVTAIPAGGNGVYAFAWTVIEADAAGAELTIANPASAATGFTFSDPQFKAMHRALVRVTVTSDGYTAHCDVFVEYQDRRKVDLGA